MSVMVVLATSISAQAADEPAPVHPASVPANMDELYGTWHGGDKASDAIYGTMKIGKSSITWKGNNGAPRCTVSYRRELESYGKKFLDQTDNNYVTASGEHRYATFLLKIKGGKCTLNITHFRLTLDREITGYLAMIEYETGTKPVGRMHFHRN